MSNKIKNSKKQLHISSETVRVLDLRPEQTAQIVGGSRFPVTTTSTQVLC